ncbi:GSOX3-like protein [Mya arenaria]|uniref:Flavin-containing monooxygenase n=1 Tax=Mya arenaria TaxID=6604 RepID=A0ABY7FLW7_MYAAR|nr:GSOX3-like protein [Mya arenaria]
MLHSKGVCVIGAGPSGMSTLYHFAKLPEMPDVVCYEKQDTWGGLWNFTWRTGVDQYGELCHSGMYKRLLPNSPKECCEYVDYTFQKHFGEDIGTSFPSREIMFVYLKGRWTNNAGRDLEQYITYSTVVRSVIYTENTEMFTVTVSDLKTGAIRTEQFTHVGIEAFDGRVVHSHDIKDGVELKNQNVLIVGSSHSPVDIALHIMTYGGKSVIVSWRTKAPNHIWPKGITEKCEVESIQGQIVTFKDGSSAVVDSIFLCTGYKTLFPFLENRLRIAEETSFYQSELYKGSLFLPVAQSKLFFVGAQDQLYTLTLMIT